MPSMDIQWAWISHSPFWVYKYIISKYLEKRFSIILDLPLTLIKSHSKLYFQTATHYTIFAMDAIVVEMVSCTSILVAI